MRIVSEMAGLAGSLGSVHRLLLLEHVLAGERPVEALATLSGLSVANTSQHLQHLRRAGLVQTRRQGKHIYYRLGSGPIRELLHALRRQAEFTQAQIEKLVSDSVRQPRSLRSITRDELLKKMKAGEVRLVDVRSPGEFDAGHLPGAKNIPFAELESRLPELPSRKEIVAYCRGPLCVLSANAAEVLSSKGFRVRHFDGGFREWQDAGLAVETPGRSRRRPR